MNRRRLKAQWAQTTNWVFGAMYIASLGSADASPPTPRATIPNRGNLYWTTAGLYGETSRIIRANLDGSNTEPVVIPDGH